MKERPILFSSSMVRAILDGSKTQTRRVVKPRADRDMGPRCVLRPHELAGEVNGGRYRNSIYGQPGERLWVREAWDFIPEGDPGTPNCAGIRYWSDAGYELRTPPSTFNPLLYGKERIRPSIHMPRWASRIQLEITGVRVEKLQDISEADAKAEGAHSHKYTGLDRAYARAYSDLWESINGAGSWAANPWVWVVEFRRIEP